MMEIPRISHILAVAVIVGLAAPAMGDVPSVGAPALYPYTPLVVDGRPACTVIAAGTDTDHAAVARTVADTLAGRYGLDFPVLPDTDLCAEPVSPISEQHRQTNLILVGNAYTNRAMLGLYAGARCGADTHYPGGDGYELRTICNPWGNGHNVVIVGFSTLDGARAAVLALSGALPALDGRQAVLPRLLDVQPGAALRNQFAASAKEADAWSFDAFEARDHVAGRFYRPVLFYHWTGNIKWAQAARDVLSFFNSVYEGRYPLSDYELESWFRAWDMIEEAPVFTPEELALTASRMVETASAMRRYGASSGARIGNRHTSVGSIGLWATADWLRRSFPDNSEVQKTAAEWQQGLREYFTTAATGFRDDRDSTESMDSIMVFYRWCLETGYGEYFTSGRARQAIQYCLTYHDSLGYTCGIDGYAEAVPGNLTMRYRLGQPLGALAFVEDSPGARWFLEHFPPGNGASAWYWPLYWGIGCYMPPTDAPVANEPPPHLVGLSALPVSERRYAMLQAGTASLAPGVSATMPPREQAIDKLCFREGFGPDDQYLLLQGFQGCQIGTVDANTIPRYTERGKIWLFQHSDQIGHYYRNGLFISNGLNTEPLPAGCRLDAAASVIDGFHMSSTTLVDYHGTDWQRAIFWEPGEWFLVMDRATATEPGYYSAMSTWRTPVYGTWTEDRLFSTTQDDVSFHVHSSAPVQASAQAEPQDGAARPFVLRERKSGKLATGDVIDFHNLLQTTDAGTPPRWEPVRLTDAAVVVRDARGNAMLLGVGGPGATQPEGIEVDAGMYALSVGQARVAGVRRLAIDGNVLLDYAEPLTAWIDLQDGQIAPGHTGPTLCDASLTWRLPDMLLAEMGKADVAVCKAVKQSIRAIIKSAAVSATTEAVQPTDAARRPLHVAWESAQLGRRGKPIGGLRVTAEGVPSEVLYQAVDGLIPTSSGNLGWDTGTPMEFEVSWPGVETVSDLRLHMGVAAPTSRPNLAEPLKAERSVQLVWSSDGFRADMRPQTVVADREIYLHNPNKGYIFPHKYLLAPVGDVQASAVRVSIPRLEGEAKLFLTEVEVLGPERGPLDTHQLLVRDITGDGDPEIIVATGHGLLSVLDSAGTLLWQKRFKGRTTRFVTGDLTRDGRQEIVVGTLENLVYALTADGEELWTTSFIGLREASNSKYCTNGEVAHTVGIWEPTPGTKRVIVGHYWYASLLGEQGTLLEAMRFNGRHRRVFEKTADVDGDGLQDAFMSYDMPWQGRTAIATLLKGDEVAQARVSVPNGIAYVGELLDGEGIRAALGTQEGFGVYDLKSNEKVWEYVGGRPLSAGIIHDADGDGVAEFYVGGRDGFVSAFSVETGEPLGTHLIGEGINDITAIGSAADSIFWVATDSALRAYNAQWQPIASLPGVYVDIEPAGGRVAAMTGDGRLQMVTMP